jgi:hypothetical protein
VVDEKFCDEYGVGAMLMPIAFGEQAVKRSSWVLNAMM